VQTRRFVYIAERWRHRRA